MLLKNRPHLCKNSLIIALRSSSHRFNTTINYSDENYQFLHKSKLKTMFFQPSLPRLPIPKLEKTCERYLAALKPILADKTYQNTVDVVNEFRKTTGAQLQKILVGSDSANKHTSYISEPWFDMYLRDRVPLPINYNPILIMKHDDRKEYNNQLLRATNIVISALRFMRALRAGYLEPEVFHLNPKKSDTEIFRKVCSLAPKSIATYVAYAFKAFPLDMSQYNGLFCATRIPEIDKDQIYRSANDSKHLLVMYKGNFFIVDVLDANGNIEQPNVILGRLKYVLESNIPAEPYPLGILTAQNRNTWAKLRQHLFKIGNKNSIKLIDSAIFCLCLDETVYDMDNPKQLVKDYLAGDGINRWFDKSISILLSQDGTAGLNFEHSWGDGVAVLRFFNEIYKEITTSGIVHPDTVPYTNDVEQKVNLIKFNIDNHMKKSIDDSKHEHKAVVDSLDVNFIRYNDINRSLCKENGISPDSVMQLAFQLGYRQLYGKYVGTYESCSTAAFKHGRTETMRPCTMATKNFCEAILKNSNENGNNAELRSMIENCSEIHGNLTKEAAMGQGFDRHLFGLKYMAEKNGLKRGKIYDDVGYEIINKNILSTSTLSSPGLLAGGFGPVLKYGFGIGYTITNDLCGTLVTSYKGEKNGEEFVKSLNLAFDIIRNILQSKKKV